MNPPPLPEPNDPNADLTGIVGHIPKGLNPWRSGPAYVALGLTTVSLAFTPVAFIGGLGMLGALAGMVFAGNVQTAAMTDPQDANPKGRNWRNSVAGLGVLALVVLGFIAVAALGSAMRAANRGKPIETGGTIPLVIMLSCGVAMGLAMLASASRKAETLQTVPLMLYWMCYVPLPLILVSVLWNGSGFGN